MSMNDFEEKAIPLLTFQNSKLILHEEALEILKKIEKPISVVGVAGKYRTGKSYLLNQVILNKNKGFEVGGTINSCTKGIWMWSKPIKGTTSDGKIINVIILDSEGLGAIDVDATHDSRIFALIMLLSSTFLFNSMGAIDEDSLESLNLIGNLTKNIQISSKNDDNENSEQFSNYMPSFLWILRDFTLELENQNGEKITSKQYLENALLEHKGSSNQIDNKNQIRKFLKKFFRERDCFTMIRPLISEENLRNLQSISQDQLKSDFRNQVLNLRKKIISEAKIKKMNEEELSGALLAVLAQKYVNTINKKALPNIQDAWSYICQIQCQQALDEALMEYSDLMNNFLDSAWPVDQNSLKTLHKDNKNMCMKIFEKKAMGEKKQEFKERLIEDVEKKFQWLKKKNIRDFEEIFQNKLEECFSETILQNLKNFNYKNFFDFEKDMRQFETEFLELEPQGPFKNVLLLEFLYKKQNEAIYLIINQQQEKFVTEISEIKKELENTNGENNQMKKLINEFKGEIQMKLKQEEREKKDIQGKYDMVKEAYEKAKQEQTKIIDEFQKKNKIQKQELEEQNLILKQEKENLEKILKKEQKENIQKIQDNDKEKALLNQKLNQLQENLVLEQKLQKDFQQNLENLKQNFEKNLIQNQQKNEEIIIQLQQEEKQLKQVLKEEKKRIENLSIFLEENEVKYKTQIQKLEKQILHLNIDLKEKEEKSKNNSFNEKYYIKIQELEKDIVEYQELFKQVNSDKKNLEEELKNLKKEKNKENALYLQNQEFLQKKLTDLEQKLNEEKQRNETTLRLLDSQSDNNMFDINKQLGELTEKHQMQIETYENTLVQLQENFQQQKYNLQDEQQKILSQKNEQINNNQKDLENLFKKLDEQSNEKLNLEQKNKDLEQKLIQLQEQIENNYVIKINELELQLSDVKSYEQKQIQLSQKKQDENFQNLKNIFEKEKERLEKKIIEDKQKYEKKIKSLIEDYDEQLENKYNENAEEIQNLQEFIQELQANIQTAQNQNEIDIQLKENEIQNLIKEKEQINKIYLDLQNNFQSQIEQITEKIKKDKYDQFESLDELKELKFNLENELWNTKQQKEQNQQDFLKKEQDLKIQIEILQKDLDEFKQKYENINSNYEEVNLTKREIQSKQETQIALLGQENQYLKMKYQDKLEIISELQEKLKNYQDQHNESFLNEQKQLKKSNENENTKLLQNIEEQNIILQNQIREYKQQILNQEKIKKDYEIQIQENQTLQQKIQLNLQDKFNQQEIILKNEIQKQEKKIKLLQQEKQDLEKQNIINEMKKEEIEANYEKDKALWENKLKFQEEQKLQINQELEKLKENFDKLMQNFQKKTVQETEENSQNRQFVIQKIQIEYEAKLKEIKLLQQNNIQLLKEQLKQQETMIKEFNLQLLEKDNLIKEKELQIKNQSETLKEQEKENLLKFQNSKKDMEKDLIKQKDIYLKSKNEFESQIKNFERIINEQEKQKTYSLFELEKEKAKQTLEKENFQTQKNEFLENIIYLQKKNEKLLKENEKLKNLDKGKKILSKSQTNTPSKSNSFIGQSRLNIKNKSIITQESKHSQLLAKENSQSKCKLQFTFQEKEEQII